MRWRAIANLERRAVSCPRCLSLVTGKRGGSPVVVAEYDHMYDVLFDGGS